MLENTMHLLNLENKRKMKINNQIKDIEKERVLTEEQIKEIISSVPNWSENCPFKKQLILSIKVKINDTKR